MFVYEQSGCELKFRCNHIGQFGKFWELTFANSLFKIVLQQKTVENKEIIDAGISFMTFSNILMIL